MNYNYIKMQQLNQDQILNIITEVHHAIQNISQNFSKEGVIVQIPKYFMNFIFNGTYFNANRPITIMDNKSTFFGKRVVPAFSNNITVYHDDMPLIASAKPIIIEIN